MKKQLTLGLVMSLLSLFTSCAKYFSEEDEEVDKKDVSMLHITPRSGDETKLKYPIKIYAFNSEGNCAGQQTIESSEASSSIALALAKGSYRIITLSGITEEEYNLPKQPSLTDVIEIKQGNKTKIPLMMGNANITLDGKATAKANITLNYMVAQFMITLSDIPNGYSAVEIEIASTYSQLSFNGEYANGENSVTAVCTPTIIGTWEAGPFYTFSGSGKNTIISIHMTKDGTMETYGYTYKNSIQANHPFILTGSYTKSITVEGNIVAGNWEKPVIVNFSFGKDSAENDDQDNEEDNDDHSEVFTVNQIPEEETIWNNCLVLEVTPNKQGNEAEVLLMGINNAINNNGKDKIYYTDAGDAIKNYSTDEIYNWRIPNKIEAQFLKSRYNENLFSINQILSNAGGTELVLDKVRYLCSNATLSFNFKSSRISDVGTTVTYYLRPVKTVHMIKR